MNDSGTSASICAETVPAGWRAIETAPKDGTTSLLLWGGGKVHEGFWGGRNWYLYRNDDMIAHPTHWLPLPSPPEAT